MKNATCYDRLTNANVVITKLFIVRSYLTIFLSLDHADHRAAPGSNSDNLNSQKCVFK